MNTGRAKELPAGLEGLRQGFEEWRETREAHARIPDSLWASAMLAAGRYGLSKTATALRVNYYALKKRLAAKRAASGGVVRNRGEARNAATAGAGAEGTSRFIELPRLALSDSGECLVAWEDASGAKMRVRLRGVGIPDLAALGRSFWDRGA
jgi:hypothetical protein